jgi:hypothetical protein
MSNRGRETSRALTEIRTVLGRARNARETIATVPEAKPGDWVFDVPATHPHSGKEFMAGRFVPTGPAEFDPDQAAMLAALDAFIAAAARWERTGRPRKEAS